MEINKNVIKKKKSGLKLGRPQNNNVVVHVPIILHDFKFVTASCSYRVFGDNRRTLIFIDVIVLNFESFFLLLIIG